MSVNTFLGWFQSHHGSLDTTAMRIGDIPGCGRGAVALRDLPKGHTLFSIPRELTLSTRTSTLPGTLGMTAWKHFGLHTGWAGLILCMMWEEFQGPASKWDGYMSILPSKFDTPMFWSEAELSELKGTAVVGKIGKADAEQIFHDKIVPVIKSRPDLFHPESIPRHFTLERYHIMGSRILSRSFQVSKWEGDEEDDNLGGSSSAADANTSIDSAAMDVEEPEPEAVTELADEDSEEEEEDVDDPADVAMVPMADMLNARYGSENSKLFYEERDLKMITTKPIKAGEQIWNTYGDPPNSDLLRRYGHVDVLPLEHPLSGTGNPADNVEVPADLVVSTVSKSITTPLQGRVDWWLENVEDDTFVILTDCELPGEFVSLVRLLLQSETDWQKTQSKGKLPKPTADADILGVAIEVLEKRLKEYSTAIQEDESLLEESLSINQRNTVVVRLGEKRILDSTLRSVQIQRELLQAAATQSEGSKRKREGGERTGGKKSRR